MPSTWIWPSGSVTEAPAAAESNVEPEGRHSGAHTLSGAKLMASCQQLPQTSHFETPEQAKHTC